MPQDNVAKIKDRLDIVEVLSDYIKVQKAGVNFKARCPFHSEKTPSFYISPERQIWHCFGCQKGGDMFGFVEEIESVDFPEALRILAAKAGVELEEFKGGPTKDKKSVLYEISELAAKFFEKQLQYSNTGQKALQYLKDRGVKDETIKEFRLGFAPNDWRALSDYIHNCGYSNDDIVNSGLAIKKEESKGGGIYDRFRSRIVFPIFDITGKVVGFSGRIFEILSNNNIDRPDLAKDGESVAKYINTPQTLIYDKSRVLYGLNKAKVDIKKADQCILVEGNMDALMSYQAGVKNVVASSGTALTPNHLRLLQRYTNNLGFCFDADQAGTIATKRGIGLALSNNFNIKVLELTDKECKDPADYINKYARLPDGQGPKWSEIVLAAKPVVEYYFDKAKTNYDPASAESKKSVIISLAPFIKRLSSRVETTHWLGQLALLLRAKEEDISADIASAKDELAVYDRTEPVLAKVETKPVIALEDNVDMISEALLSVVIKNPVLFKAELSGLSYDLIHPTASTVLKTLSNEQLDNFQFGEFVKQFPKDEAMKLEFAYLRSQELWQDADEKDLKQEFGNLIMAMNIRTLNDKLSELEQDIKQAELSKNTDKIKTLLAQFVELSREKSNIQNLKYFANEKTQNQKEKAPQKAEESQETGEEIQA